MNVFLHLAVRCEKFKMKKMLISFVVFFDLSRYGQMTAGSYCYIGPQGIVHGTYVRKLI